MKRVLVVGCPASGKTTFARHLAEKTGLPLIHLDYYYHQKKYNYHDDKEAWRKRVLSLVESDEWIIDGNYGSTFPERFEKADTVVFFDLPRRVVMYRLFKRRLQYVRRTRKDMPSDWREKIDWEFLRFVWRFNRDRRHKITDAIDANLGKQVVVFRTSREAAEYLKVVQ